ncbi:hypothetical protein DYD21_19935 [Rhodohalobacter sp. SW132]|uniref:hypothetical protein n=1 Tax=Rhodohalobacter sp. SW132 TaxID=2293433 RepID=UPI000E252FA0|nr:hypothetical protein [Rhodohalobacter sp. SW132]REL24082.1 hypothetical protein DYD21_19935 [Rhodohalobacter sp. SW132]
MTKAIHYITNGSPFDSLKLLLVSLGVLVMTMMNPSDGISQEINFSEYGTYTLHLENVTLSDLQFDGAVVRNGGVYEISLTEAVSISAIGVHYLDILVDINGTGELLLNGDPSYSGDPLRSIPFTMKAGYANRGINQVSDAEYIHVTGTGTNNIGNARFPIKAREFQLPGPPPIPQSGDFNQESVNSEAFIFLYGEIDVGNIFAGFYSGSITVTIEYQ